MRIGRVPACYRGVAEETDPADDGDDRRDDASVQDARNEARYESKAHRRRDGEQQRTAARQNSKLVESV